MIAFFTVIFLMVFIAILPLKGRYIHTKDERCPYKIDPTL